MKTTGEFLEELKEHLDNEVYRLQPLIGKDKIMVGLLWGYERVRVKIEQFQRFQAKQDNNNALF